MALCCVPKSLVVNSMQNSRGVHFEEAYNNGRCRLPNFPSPPSCTSHPSSFSSLLELSIPGHSYCSFAWIIVRFSFSFRYCDAWLCHCMTAPRSAQMAMAGASSTKPRVAADLPRLIIRLVASVYLTACSNFQRNWVNFFFAHNFFQLQMHAHCSMVT